MATKEPSFYPLGTEPSVGDILTVQRTNVIYIHYGIYVGDNQVVHFSGPVGDDILNPEQTQIRKTSLEDFLRGDPLLIQIIDEDRRKYTPEEVKNRALSCVGKAEVVGGKYNFMLNNCEHFATWCVYGTGESHQIHKFGKMGADATVAAIDLVTGAITFLKQIGFGRKKKTTNKEEKETTKTITYNKEALEGYVPVCPRCGNQIKEDDNFCSKCGYKLQE